MRVLFISLGIVILDQVTKLLVKGVNISSMGLHLEGMRYGQSKLLIGDWLKITYIENPNMAFGLEFGGKIFLSVFSLLAAIGIVIYLYMHRNRSLPFRLALALILAGAVGNLIDRMFYGVLFNETSLFFGNVVDFIDFDLFMVNVAGWSFKFWPVFNVADVAVSAGVILLLISGISPEIRSVQSDSGAAQTENGNDKSDEMNPRSLS